MHGCIYIYYRYCHLKGSSLLLLDAWEVRMDNLTFNHDLQTQLVVNEYKDNACTVWLVF